MIFSVKAATYIRSFRSGRTCPYLMLCEADGGRQVEAVVKLYAGKESSRASLVCELLASLLAQDLDLVVPLPYLVEVDLGFYTGIPDLEPAARFKNSPGLNFGSQFFGPGYTTWPQAKGIPESLMQTAAEIFAFDLIVQNPDRRKDKPNLLRKGDDLVIIDHEMAFSFLYSFVPDEFPWEGKGIDFVKDHLFYNELKGRELSLDRLRGALEAIDDRRLGVYMNTIPGEWLNDCGIAAKRILEYLVQARNNSEKLFQKIAEVLK